MASPNFTPVEVVRLALQHMPIHQTYEEFIKETMLTIQEAVGGDAAATAVLMYEAFGQLLLLHYDLRAQLRGEDTIPADLKMKYNAFNGAMLKLAQVPEDDEEAYVETPASPKQQEENA